MKIKKNPPQGVMGNRFNLNKKEDMKMKKARILEEISKVGEKDGISISQCRER